MKSEFHKRIREENVVPDLPVKFNPPHNLLQTERSIKGGVPFGERARNNLQILADLFSEEIERISKEINVSVARLILLILQTMT